MGLDGGETLPEPNICLNIWGMLGRMLRRFGRGLTVLPAFYPTYAGSLAINTYQAASSSM